MSSILIAGIGNIFQGDDAFGVEVVQRLGGQALPPGVFAVDFGIRGIDLVYALMDDHDAVVLVDAAQRGATPGTVSVIEVDSKAELPTGVVPLLSPHSLDPAAALAMVRSMGGDVPPVFLVACEPQTFGGDDGIIGLSASVAAAVEPAIRTVQALVRRLHDEMQTGRSVSCGKSVLAC